MMIRKANKKSLIRSEDMANVLSNRLFCILSKTFPWFSSLPHTPLPSDVSDCLDNSSPH